MLIDITQEYTKEKIDFLTNLRKKIITNIAAENDPKKIISFLSKVGVVEIDEKNKKIIIGVSNEFVLLQVKKFFGKQIQKATKIIYSPNFDVEFFIFPNFSDKKHPLLINLKKTLGISNISNIENGGNGDLEKDLSNQLQQYFGILFDTKFRFDNFIVGASNQLAFAASKAVAEHPAEVYNPLFLYGDVGLGKTHLLQAIGNYVISHYTDMPVVYLPTSKFLDEIIKGIRKNNLTAVIQKFEKVKILILDDIQFLAGADKTQEIFHNIFNEFLIRNKQIIISSDRPPRELSNIADRLKSRFAFGLVTDIQKPDFETRFAILQQKLSQKGEDIPYELLLMLAKYITSNVRELEGALNLLLTKKKFLGQNQLSEKDIWEVLKTLGYENFEDKKSNDTKNKADKAIKKIKFNDLVEKVANFYDVKVEDLLSTSRKKEVSNARQILMYLAKKYYGWSLNKIGDFFGGKNHTSVMYAISNVENRLKGNEELGYELEKFEEIIKGE